MIKKLVMAAALAVASTAASAATMDFAVDWGNSSVVLTDQSSGGLNCAISNCGISASLVGSGGSFSLEQGNSEEFGFIRFEGTGTTGTAIFPNDRDFVIEATLAFDPPSASASGTGTGGVHLLFGSIVGGNLQWTGVPSQVALADGSLITIDFDSGSSWLIDHDTGYTLKASVSADYIAPAPVPLPAGAVLLLGGLGTFSAFRLRGKRA